MKNALAAALIGVALASTGFADGKGPDIRIVDGKISIQAEAVPLSRLLRLLDLATGMTSKVPPELANRNVSVQFSNLPFDAAVRKIFEGQPLDYIVVQGKSILVTGTSQQLTADNSPAPYNPPPPENVFVEDNPAFLPPQPPNQNPPAMIQTPFGPIANPRANMQGQQQNGNNPAMPMVAPGQQPVPQNPFNNGLPGFNGATPLPGLQPTPPFGSPQSPGAFPSQPQGPGISPMPRPIP